MEESRRRRWDGERDPNARPRGSRSHRESREAAHNDPAAAAAAAPGGVAPRSERRHRNPGEERDRDHEHRRPAHSSHSHSHSSHSHGHRSERDVDRDTEHSSHRAERAERRERGEHGDRGDARPVQIVQRSGGSGGGHQVKILGQSSSHRSRPPPESSHSGLGAVPEDSRHHQEGQPAAAPKKKQGFTMPAPAAPFARCRLMDEEWRVCVDAVHPHLMESGSEFTVVACVGAQGVGKSTVLSLLLSSFKGLLGKAPGDEKADALGAAAGGPGDSPHGLRDSSPERDAGFEAPLHVHSLRSFLEGEASPAGVDICISTMDRLLLLDAQPLFACEALPEAELKSELYLLMFLTSVCHTLLVVTDTPVDLQLWKLLRLLAMLKSKVPDLAAWVERQGDGGERPDHFPLRESLPRIVIAFNNLKQGCSLEKVYEPVQAFMEHTLWKGAPSMQAIQIPTLPGTSLSALLTSAEAYKAGMRLREQVFAHGPERGRFGKERVQLTEREWLYHASGYWDFVQKAPIVQDFFNLLGQGLESYGWPQC